VRFSQKIGKSPIKAVLQLEQMDAELRNALWDAFHLVAVADTADYLQHDPKLRKFYQTLWHQFFKRPIDQLHDRVAHNAAEVRAWFFAREWFQAYDFSEFVAGISAAPEAYRQFCNDVVERELSGYRFVGDRISPITDNNELAAIGDALGASAGLAGVRTHLGSALEKFSDRRAPDYRNSIKESISAVESMVRLLTADHSAELGRALKQVEDGVGLHPALKKGFSALYGYTSDEGGIRHALMDESKVESEDAKYMLVACSAFINYLLAKSARAEGIQQIK
jgi:hypothetical protein